MVSHNIKFKLGSIKINKYFANLYNPDNSKAHKIILLILANQQNLDDIQKYFFTMHNVS